MHPAAMGIFSHTLRWALRELTKPLRLQEIFATPTTIRLLDLMLQNPGRPWTQGALVEALPADPHTIRNTIQHLQALGLVEVHTPMRVGPMKAISLRLDTPLGAALLTFHQALMSDESVALQ
jgi:wyosine [tRNA(Phe)-imidazoG37] synthetase (radical SAM superfamily)